MSDLKTSENYKEQYGILNNLSLLLPTIIPSHTIYFIEYQSLFSKILRRKQDHDEGKLHKKIKILMLVLKQSHPDSNFLFVVKKYAFLHMLTHQVAINGHFDNKISELLNEYATELVNKDIPDVLGPCLEENKNKVKRQSSLSRIYNSIRSISFSKDKQRDRSKLKIQEGREKGALKQIILKIINPLALYLSKITQDLQTYSYILHRKIEPNNFPTLKWKINNYLRSLCKIVMQLNRLGKYYKEEMLGIWILLNHVISKDVAIYYYIIITDLSKRAREWKQSLAMHLKLQKINKKYVRQFQSRLNQPKLLQLKDELEMAAEIKEDLFYLYYNIQIHRWTQLMDIAFDSRQKNEVMEPITFLQDLFEQNAIGRKKKEDKGLKKELIDPKRRAQSESKQEIVQSPLANYFSITKEKTDEDTPKTSSTVQPSPQRHNNFIHAKKAKAMGL